MVAKPIGKSPGASKKAKSPVRKKSSAGPMAASEDKRWQRECDLRTLREAEAIRSDKARLAAARSEAQAQMRALGRVAKGGK